MTEEKYDLGCPYVKFEFWDASVSLDTRHGDYECHTVARGFQPCFEGDDKWRYPCDCENHNECFYYKKEKGLEEKVE